MKKTLRICTVLLTAFILCTTAVFAAVPDPSPSFYVTDEANVISSTTEDYIVSKNGELESLCGAQIVVVTVDFLDGMDIEDYSYKIFNEWEIGSAEEDNGVLLLLTIGEENYWCMQGTGLEDDLTSGEIDDMLWYYLEEDFAAGDYDAGVRSFFDKMYYEICDIYDTQTVGSNLTGEDDGGLNILYVVIGIIVVLIVVAVIKALLKSPSRRRTTSSYPSYPSRRRPSGHYRPAPRHTPPRPHHRPAPPARPMTRPASRPSSKPSLFGGSSGGSRSSSSSRSSGSRSVGRSSSRGSGGGGRSRGGGAGRRGR